MTQTLELVKQIRQTHSQRKNQFSSIIMNIITTWLIHSVIPHET